MQSKLSDHVDYLSGIYNKECKSCMERKEIKSECEFIWFRNNRLNCKCKEYRKKSTNSKNGVIKTFLNMHQFCNDDFE